MCRLWFTQLGTCLILLCFLLTSCKDSKVPFVKDEIDKEVVTSRWNFATKKQAKEGITTDATEGYFDHVRKLDMCIQLKNEDCSADRESILSDYQKLLKASIVDFTIEEKAYLKDIMTEAYQLMDDISFELTYEDVLLAKISNNHYGKGVYYTRDNFIFIPEDQLAAKNRSAMLETMIHELFHIYSRYNKPKQKLLYELIGFSKTAFTIPSELDKRILLNPDGVDFHYQITIDDNGTKRSIVPIIYSVTDNYDPKKGSFFAHLNYELFEQSGDGEETTLLVNKTQHMSTGMWMKHPDFERQIGTNTNYIIHPDEILADNVALLCLGKKDSKNIEHLTEDGKELLKKIEKIIIQ